MRSRWTAWRGAAAGRSVGDGLSGWVTTIEGTVSRIGRDPAARAANQHDASPNGRGRAARPPRRQRARSICRVSTRSTSAA
jgi:hypothetical protein